MNLRFAFIASCILIITSCHFNKRQTSLNTQIGRPVSISIERTACFGTCPIYTLTVDSSGLLDFYGKRFTEMNGNWSNHIDKTEVDDFFNWIENENLNQYKNNYPSDYTDLPSVILTYTTIENVKVIQITGNRPARVDTVVNKIDLFIKRANWENNNLK